MTDAAICPMMMRRIQVLAGRVRRRHKVQLHAFRCTPFACAGLSVRQRDEGTSALPARIRPFSDCCTFSALLAIHCVKLIISTCCIRMLAIDRVPIRRVPISLCVHTHPVTGFPLPYPAFTFSSRLLRPPRLARTSLRPTRTRTAFEALESLTASWRVRWRTHWRTCWRSAALDLDPAHTGLRNMFVCSP